MDILNTLSLKSNRQIKTNLTEAIYPLKDYLASQPTLPRFFNRMDESALLRFDDIDKTLMDIIRYCAITG